jgi:stage V sporulation protein SpoVS
MTLRDLRRRILKIESAVRPEDLAHAVAALLAGESVAGLRADVLGVAERLVADLRAIDAIDGRAVGASVINPTPSNPKPNYD